MMCLHGTDSFDEPFSAVLKESSDIHASKGIAERVKTKIAEGIFIPFPITIRLMRRG